MTSYPVGRLAPSPSGRMHLGNVFSFLCAWLSVKSQNGTLILRIEDLDTVRCTHEFADLIKGDLKWLGISWDQEMPYQSTRTDFYREKIEDLSKQGLIYPCWCTRGSINVSNAPHASDGHPIYPGTCRNLTKQERLFKKGNPCYRILVPPISISFEDRIFGKQTEILTEECGDFILQKADGSFAYQLACVVDDIDGGVTEVVRGCDLIGSTARQIWLASLWGSEPFSYMHVPMLTGPEGRKLSKRDFDLDLGKLRQSVVPEEILGFLAYYSGMISSLEPVTINELLKEFDYRKIRKENITIDPSYLLNKC